MIGEERDGSFTCLLTHPFTHSFIHQAFLEGLLYARPSACGGRGGLRYQGVSGKVEAKFTTWDGTMRTLWDHEILISGISPLQTLPQVCQDLQTSPVIM